MRKVRPLVVAAFLLLTTLDAPTGVVAHTITCQDLFSNNQSAGIERSSPNWSAMSVQAFINYNAGACTNNAGSGHPSAWIGFTCRVGAVEDCSVPTPYAIVQIGIATMTGPSYKVFWEIDGCNDNLGPHYTSYSITPLTEVYFRIDHDSDGHFRGYYGPAGQSIANAIKIFDVNGHTYGPLACWYYKVMRADYIAERADRGDSFGSSRHPTQEYAMRYKTLIDGSWVYDTIAPGDPCSYNQGGSGVNPVTCFTDAVNEGFSAYD